LYDISWRLVHIRMVLHGKPELLHSPSFSIRIALLGVSGGEGAHDRLPLIPPWEAVPTKHLSDCVVAYGIAIMAFLDSQGDLAR
jgi:hypothetical protein